MIRSTALKFAERLNDLARLNDYGGRYSQIEREFSEYICSTVWSRSGSYRVAYRTAANGRTFDRAKAIYSWQDAERATRTASR